MRDVRGSIHEGPLARGYDVIQTTDAARVQSERERERTRLYRDKDMANTSTAFGTNNRDGTDAVEDEDAVVRC